MVPNPDLPSEAPHETAPPRNPDAIGNARPVRGLAGAEDSVMAEGVDLGGGIVGLDEGAPPCPGGAEVAPADGFAKPEHEVGSFLLGAATVRVPAASLRKNALIRRKVVPANVAPCVIGAAATSGNQNAKIGAAATSGNQNAKIGAAATKMCAQTAVTPNP